MLFSRGLLVVPITLVLAFCPAATGFESVSIVKKGLRRPTSLAGIKSRREFGDTIAIWAITGAVAGPAFTTSVNASGGATAGGAYLLSAKQRYNDRVSKGVAGFLDLRSSLDTNDGSKLDNVRLFFLSDDVGAWKDFSAAGYLLANAFRRNSSAAPDSLPAVKKWKAFAAQVEGITKALKKKDSNGAFQSYEKAVAALDDYLQEVDLSEK